MTLASPFAVGTTHQERTDGDKLPASVRSAASAAVGGAGRAAVGGVWELGGLEGWLPCCPLVGVWPDPGILAETPSVLPGVLGLVHHSQHRSVATPGSTGPEEVEVGVLGAGRGR